MNNSAFGVFSETPGPGAYNTQKYKKDPTIKYSFAQKYNEKPDNVNPGPGVYQ